YSLMAIGLGRMMGFEFPQNFNSPYVSVSMTEFWRRWHMTLGSWFREYVYIPLGGNRRGMVRTIFNLFVVWMLTGIWHGADWNFVIWGLFLFLIMTVERFGLKDVLDKHRRAGRIYMLLLIPLQWMVFAISDLGQLKIFYGRLIGIGGENVVGTDWLMQLKDFWWIFILAVFFSTEIPGKLYKKYKNNPVVYVLLAGVLGVAVYCLLMGLDDPFMYFRF
ncbi:MAG: MBOAT family protein, partial [Firmicutes bacterium]|nr:MBOAT family protein [Bacillota bacterium]